MADDLYLNPHNINYSDSSISCESCKHANIVCDGFQPSCSTCLQHGIICMYNRRTLKRRLHSQSNLHCTIPERQFTQGSQQNSQNPSTGSYTISDLVPRITISSTSEQYPGQPGYENPTLDRSYFYSSPSPTFHSPMPSSPVSPYGSVNYYHSDNLSPQEHREFFPYGSPLLNASPNNSLASLPTLIMPEIGQGTNSTPAQPVSTIPQMSQVQGNSFSFPDFVKISLSRQERLAICYYFRHVHTLIPVVDVVQFQSELGWESERHSALGSLVGAMIGLSEQHLASPDSFSKSAALFLSQVNLDAYFPSNQSQLGTTARSHNASASYLLDQLNSFHFAHDCS